MRLMERYLDFEPHIWTFEFLAETRQNRLTGIVELMTYQQQSAAILRQCQREYRFCKRVQRKWEGDAP